MNPTMTFSAAGNLRADAALGAGQNANIDVDLSSKLEGQITIKNTPTGAISATRGLKIEIFSGYGAGPSYTTITPFTRTLPSAVLATAESFTFYLPTGKYRIKITNLDAANATSVEITSATVDGIS